jgi:hypothetical protein
VSLPSDLPAALAGGGFCKLGGFEVAHTADRPPGWGSLFVRRVIFTGGSPKLVQDESCIARPCGILPMTCRRFFSVIIGLLLVSGFAAHAAEDKQTAKVYGEWRILVKCDKGPVHRDFLEADFFRAEDCA